MDMHSGHGSHGGDMMSGAQSALPAWMDPIYSDPMIRTYTRDHHHMGMMGMSMGGHAEHGPKEIASDDIGAQRNITVALTFSLDFLPGEQAIVTRDLRGDGAGDMQVLARDGQLWVELESGSGDTEWLKVPDLVLAPETTYHLAVSMGGSGLMVWLNGRLVASEPEAKSGWMTNDHPILIGGSRSNQTEESDPAHSRFGGEIGNVYIFDKQLNQKWVNALAEAADPSLGAVGEMAEAVDDLIPALTQLHHGSDAARMFAMDYGIMPMPMQVNGDVPMTMITRPLDMASGSNQRDKMNGSKAADGIDGRGGNDKIKGKGGHDILQGGSGNDTINGNRGHDILDGGEGEDVIRGGRGNDLLIARGDAREPFVGPDPGRDEGDPYNELTNGKLYPDQPTQGDDLLIGGKGADIFYFQTLINAKERYIEKHTNDNGVINWHGVAGENDNIHDHWVDHQGWDVVADFSRAEGDRIVIEGHTTTIRKITYGDGNGDGVMDMSEIYLYSEQGNNGGAHNQDKLGTIKVYGDLVLPSDIEHTAAPAYGIVEHIGDLRDALEPMEDNPDAGRIAAPRNQLKKFADQVVLDQDGEAPVLAIPGALTFDPEERDHVVFRHSQDLALDSGTIAMSFTAEDTRWMALFSKDADGQDVPGHLAAFVEDDGDLVVRIQDRQDSHYLVARSAIEVGTEYDLAVSWGSKGASLWLDGIRVAYRSDLKIDLEQNGEDIVVGATGWRSTPGTTDDVHGYFDGTIADFAVYEGQQNAARLGHEGEGTLVLDGPASDYSFEMGNTRMILTKGDETTRVAEDVVFLSFSDRTVRPEQVQIGGNGADTIEGDQSADILIGNGGDDRLGGRDNDDFLDGGFGNDHLWGGRGSDLLHGGMGDDRLDGNEDADELHGGFGDDTFAGGSGNDAFYGGFGDDDFYGNSWAEAGRDTDTVYYEGALEDYTFERDSFENSTRGATVDRILVTDHPSGGADGFYEGEDRLVDIEKLHFAASGVTVDVSDLPFV